MEFLTTPDLSSAAKWLASTPAASTKLTSQRPGALPSAATPAVTTTARTPAVPDLPATPAHAAWPAAAAAAVAVAAPSNHTPNAAATRNGAAAIAAGPPAHEATVPHAGQPTDAAAAAPTDATAPKPPHAAVSARFPPPLGTPAVPPAASLPFNSASLPTGTPVSSSPFLSVDRAGIKNSFQSLFSPAANHDMATPSLLRPPSSAAYTPAAPPVGLTPYINGLSTPSLVPPSAMLQFPHFRTPHHPDPAASDQLLTSPYLKAAAKEAVRREFMSMPTYVSTPVPQSHVHASASAASDRAVPSPKPTPTPQVAINTGALVPDHVPVSKVVNDVSSSSAPSPVRQQPPAVTDAAPPDSPPGSSQDATRPTSTSSAPSPHTVPTATTHPVPPSSSPLAPVPTSHPGLNPASASASASTSAPTQTASSAASVAAVPSAHSNPTFKSEAMPIPHASQAQAPQPVQQHAQQMPPYFIHHAQPHHQQHPGMVMMGPHGQMMVAPPVAPPGPMYAQPSALVMYPGAQHVLQHSNVAMPQASALQAHDTAMKQESQVEKKARIEHEKQELIREFKKKTREAALVRFRQKRRERRFGKLIRYDCRKKLADARPRVKGRFVRMKSEDDEEDMEMDCVQVVPGLMER